MSADIVLWLVQDGITTGAIYALLALALLLVFAVTRIIFVPQGEFVSYAALSLGMLQTGQTPGTVWVLIAGGAIVAVLEGASALARREPARLARILAVYVAGPLAIAALARWGAAHALGLWAQMAIVAALVVPLGPLLYRIAYRPLADASVLVLFIVSMAAHYVLSGLGLVIFGGEGLRTNPISEARFDVGVLKIGAQSVWVAGASLVCMIALWLFFEHTLVGKALRATAINRVGARLAGIPAGLTGSIAFVLAAAIGAASGVLISPIATIYYDSGLMISLKGFVGAILGGMASYPLAALGALGVGLIESFSSFWASALKETIVFTLIIPVLLWRSLASRHPAVEDEEE
ncbi:MAG TPA: branched-chain amino acid ABC transporter permease [Rhodocyclaceae bacterium]|nr:MAG: branched-chain amino acid ABC transporter permease [Betaproteobacteria bacterium CG2_30_68_42]PIV71355.1 MAG: branched-chain amino acid ABC transporter permease [Rhodocyclales bacterium CG17_big_fil_post_rev_8_21_14_2_50_68_7]PJA57271.1 MAG: branched-chain amino acid ABC transporter permease [Rhodocyclales bacterium CG_4_9_14_3_um_filter_68_10]HCX32758.1 branched-chain amino acid ABC transporter permease [Rhodocyclaceae bacterium]